MQTETGSAELGANGHGAGPSSSSSATADSVSSAVSRELHTVLTDIEDLITATTSLTGEDLARAKAKLAARVAAARESVKKLGGAIADRARNTVKLTDDFVQERSWQAVGIGAGIGLLIGYVLGRRR